MDGADGARKAGRISRLRVAVSRGGMSAVRREFAIIRREIGAGRYFSSPVSLSIPENPEKLPRAVQIRARYVDKDTLVGQYSFAVTTATQPAG